eukprot:1839057-Pleurochrysis_carterae.AAC.1
MRPTSLRALASHAAGSGMLMRRWDFVAAYLQGNFQQGEVMYCHAPPGYGTVGSDGRPRICRVEKPIYGMAQAGRRWQRTLFPWLRDYGFTQSSADPCVFTLSSNGQQLILGCYVDDLFILHRESGAGSLYATFTEALAARWNVEDEGAVSDLLNVEIHRTSDHVTLSQASYIRHMVDAFS